MSPPEAVVRRRWRVSPIWLVPIACLGIVAYLAWTTLTERGPEITLVFETGAGLSENQTQVKHNAVVIGTVDDVALADDLSHVVVKVRMTSEAKPMLTDHARFWVVRPRFTGLGGLATGIQALVSGTYVEMDPGPPGGKPQREFRGLERPPGVRSDQPGRVFVLEAERLGSLSVGSPLYYRDVAVGEVLSADVTGEGDRPVSMRVFVRAPYDRKVRTGTRFWNASGLTLSTTGAGLHLELESLHSVVAGAIGFETIEPGKGLASERETPSPLGPEPRYVLYGTREDAETALYTERIHCATYVAGAVGGVVAGTHVEMLGVVVGAVTQVRLVDREEQGIRARIAFDVQPERVSIPLTRRSIVEERLHAVVETASMLTGSKVLALEREPGVAPSVYRDEDGALIVPGEDRAGGLTSSLARAASRLEKVPFERIGEDLDATIRSIHETVSSDEMRAALTDLRGTLGEVRDLARDVHSGLGPALARVPEIAEQLEHAVKSANVALGPGGYGRNSDFQRNMERLMRRVTEAARSIRLLADLLARHPESVVRGRDANTKSEP